MGQRAEAYIVDAIRSPTGRRRGSLASVHGADLGAFILKALVERHDIPDHESTMTSSLVVWTPLGRWQVILHGPAGLLLG